ncbi:MAG: MaoC family dehydratase N-terminal domain-containing protein [Nitrospirae bacterium]|nr:MaoC family dehydratase N-terminal domain-containing protein [Nitrospirota bacterium]
MEELKTLEELKIGDTYKDSLKITNELLQGFIELSKDQAPVHIDSEHAKKMGFNNIIVPGFLVSLGYSRILGMFLPGSNTIIHNLQIDMTAPVYIDDIIIYEVNVSRLIPSVKAVQLKLSAFNQVGIQVSKGSAVCVFRL